MQRPYGEVEQWHESSREDGTENVEAVEVDPPGPTRAEVAQSKFHLINHHKFNPDCQGCQAKARDKRHFRYSFDRQAKANENVVTMDQVTMADVDATTTDATSFKETWIRDVNNINPLNDLQSAVPSITLGGVL